MTSRILALEGVDNFRDFGDYGTAAGRRVHPGRLYRSANHGMATPADLEAIGALGLAVVVDLRRTEERQRVPNRRPEGCRAVVISSDIDENPDDPDPWLTFLKGSDLTPGSLHGYLFDYYRAAPFASRHVDLFSRYFQALAEADGPVLIHCAAGKDRTGLLAALTHHLVGVHGDDIVEDYLLTNDEARFERRTPMVLQHIAEATGRQADAEVARIAMGVDAAYLETALEAIRQANGSIDAYLAEVLGVDAPLRERLERQLLA
jgi:protein tyrosine/serine phosphatase